MIYKQTTEITENSHGIYGAGTFIITIDWVNDYYYYSVEGENMPKIEYFGEKAKELIKLFTDSILTVKKAASESCGIDFKLIDNNEKTRKWEVVLACNLVMWYARKHLKGYSLRRAGSLVGKDHATVLHAIKDIERPKKYQKKERWEMIQKFKQEMNLP